MSSGVNKTFLMKVDGKPNDFNYQTIHFTLGRSSLASVETFLNNYLASAKLEVSLQLRSFGVLV